MNYPNMYPEIIEAVHLMYEDEPDVEVDCLLYLKSLKRNQKRATALGIGAEDALKDMDRCPDCGERLEVYRYKEPHPELDGCPIEDTTELYCPNCDIGQMNSY